MAHGTSADSTHDHRHGTNHLAEVERALRTIFKRCVACPPGNPSCPSCKSNEICSLVPQSCDACAYMTCIANPAPAPNVNSGPNVGAIAGGVVGGIAAISIVVFFVWFCWIRKRRQQQEEEWEAEEEEWENDDIAQQKTRSFPALREDAASTRTRGSLANSFLSRASNIIQIAYIPGVTNRNGSGHNSLLGPVPPVPAARRQGVEAAPKSPLSNPGDQLFFRPGDLRDSSYSATSSMASGGNNRDTQYTRQSITPSLARSSMASGVYRDDATEMPMPAQTVTRAAPRMVSVKSASSGSESPTSTLIGEPSVQDSTPASKGKGKGVQVLMPGQPSDSGSLGSTGSMSGKAKQVTLGGKGRFPIRQPSDASTAPSTLSTKHMPNVSSPLAEVGNEDSEDEEEEDDEHARARQSLINTNNAPLIQPVESPFYDASERPPANSSSSSRPNPYAAMSSSVGGAGDQKRGGKGIGGLSAVIEEATKRASRVPSHDGLGGKRDASPFGDEHATGK